MCKAKQVSLMCEECRQAIEKETKHKIESQNEKQMAEKQMLDLRLIEKVLKEEDNDSKIGEQNRTEKVSTSDSQVNCQCQSLNEEAYFDMESYGCMIPDPKIKSFDPSKSSDFMIIDSQICGVADGVSQ